MRGRSKRPPPMLARPWQWHRRWCRPRILSPAKRHARALARLRRRNASRLVCLPHYRALAPDRVWHSPCPVSRRPVIRVACPGEPVRERSCSMEYRYGRVVLATVILTVLGISPTIDAQFRARDPGVRGGAAGAGGMLPGLTTDEQEMFNVGLEDFGEEEKVADGVGPRFNFVSCAGCHAQPAIGGSSPAANPLFRVVGDLRFSGTQNRMPSFITPGGPVREARFQFNPDGTRDGGVHALFVITGHPEAPAGCGIGQ